MFGFLDALFSPDSLSFPGRCYFSCRYTHGLFITLTASCVTQPAFLSLLTGPSTSQQQGQGRRTRSHAVVYIAQPDHTYSSANPDDIAGHLCPFDCCRKDGIDFGPQDGPQFAKHINQRHYVAEKNYTPASRICVVCRKAFSLFGFKAHLESSAGKIQGCRARDFWTNAEVVAHQAIAPPQKPKP